MGVPLIRARGHAPGVAVSAVLTATVASVLPGPLPWVAFLGALATTLSVLSERAEPVAVRALFAARAMTPAERTALAPVIVLLCQRSLGRR